MVLRPEQKEDDEHTEEEKTTKSKRTQPKQKELLPNLAQMQFN
jgi:hypothetical protein